MNAPDPRLHQRVSFVKSAVRIVGYLCLPVSLWAAAAALTLAELLGVFEELV